MSPAMRAPPRPHLWRDPAFVRLWVGVTCSGLATWALPFVLGLAVVDGQLSGGELGLVLGVRTTGFLIAVPAAGVWADRHSRRLVVAAAGTTASVATLCLASSLGRSALWMVASALLIGAGQGACRPAFQALTAEVVAIDSRLPANAAITVGVRLAVLVSPPLVALAASVTSPSTLVLTSAGLWAAAAALPPRGTRPPMEGMRRVGGLRRRLVGDWCAGVAEARRHRWFIAGLFALAAVIMTGYSATAVALPLVSRDELGSESLLAWSMFAYAAGALAGAAIVTRVRHRSPGWVALIALASYGFAPLALAGPVPTWAIVSAYVVAGAGVELFNVPWFTATQREVRPHLLARVSSLDFLVSYGLAPLGLVFIAPAISVFGMRPVLVACATICFAAPLLAAAVPTSRTFKTRAVLREAR